MGGFLSMAMRLVEGDYVPNAWGGFETVSGGDALLQRIFFKLKARRGSFPLLPELGSRLYLLSRERPSGRRAAAEMYVREALADEPDLALTELTVTERDGELTLDMTFSYDGGEASLQMTV